MKVSQAGEGECGGSGKEECEEPVSEMCSPKVLGVAMVTGRAAPPLIPMTCPVNPENKAPSVSLIAHLVPSSTSCPTILKDAFTHPHHLSLSFCGNALYSPESCSLLKKILQVSRVLIPV